MMLGHAMIRNITQLRPDLRPFSKTQDGGLGSEWRQGGATALADVLKSGLPTSGMIELARRFKSPLPMLDVLGFMLHAADPAQEEAGFYDGSTVIA